MYEVQAPAGEKPDLLAKSIMALIDAGAGGDCIDDALTVRLGLPIHEEGEISGVGGRVHAVISTEGVYVPSLNKRLVGPLMGVKP